MPSHLLRLRDPLHPYRNLTSVAACLRCDCLSVLHTSYMRLGGRAVSGHQSRKAAGGAARTGSDLGRELVAVLRTAAADARVKSRDVVYVVV
jgi:hypothetical protein